MKTAFSLSFNKPAYDLVVRVSAS